MIVNRYTTGPVAQYNPLSMDELAFAPTFLRQRHDQAQAQMMELDQMSNQYDVLDQYGVAANQLVQPFQQDIQSLAEQLATQGVQQSQAIPQAMKLKSQYNQLFGQQGGIGQLQARTQQYREQVKQIQEQFKDNPELARGAINRLNAGEAIVGEDGRLQLGQMQTPNYVRHYDAKEVNDILSKQIGNIKDTLLKDFGFQKVGSISSIQDVYRQGQLEGRDVEEITNILMSQLSPEIIQSAKQYGDFVLGDPSLGLESLKLQIEGAALGRASEKLNSRFNVYTNEDRKAAQERTSALTTSPGPLVTRTMSDVLSDAGLKFDASGNNIIDAPTTSQQIRQFFDNLSVGPFAGWKLINQGLDELGVLLNNPTLALQLVNPTTSSVALNQITQNDKLAKELYQKTKDKIKEDMTNTVSQLKGAYPELSGLSNKDAYNIITEARNNFAAVYSDVVAPQDADFSYINRQILGTSNTIGDLERRQVFAGDQKLGTGKDLFKQLGYSNFKEFLEEGNPQMETGITFAGKTPASFVMNVLDKKGNSVTVNVESNKEFQAAGRVPNKMLEYIQKGDLFKELDEETSVRDFGVKADPGNKWYYIFDLEESSPQLVEAPKGLSPVEIRDFKLQNPDNVYNYSEAVNNGIQSIFYNTPSGNLLRRKK